MKDITQHGFVSPGKEPVLEGGRHQGDDEWKIVDCGSVIVHMFTENSRLRYDVEDLWGEEKVFISGPEKMK